MKTELKNRTLWFDGTSQVAPDMVPDLLLEGVPPTKIVVTESNDDVDQYNNFSDVAIAFGKLTNKRFEMWYRVPQEFKQMDLEAYINTKLYNLRKNIDPRYVARAEAELKEIQLRSMVLLVKTLIYVIDEFQKTKTFWGVGRGSSCASLILFLIGLHKVDPIKYNIPMTEFFHD